MRRSDRKQTVEKSQQLKSKLEKRKAINRDHNYSEVIELSSGVGDLNKKSNNSKKVKSNEEVFISETED